MKVLAPGYYSRQDTKTPVKYGIWCMAANMLFNLIFALPYGYIGLAIATSLSATLNAVLLYIGLYRQNVYKISRLTRGFVMRVVVATTAMAMSIVWMQYNVPFTSLVFKDQVISLTLTILLAVAVFGASLFMMGIRFRHFKSRNFNPA